MSLPGSVATYDSVPLIDLDECGYLVAVRQPHWKLRAWSALEETERRWTLFDWATFVVHQPRRCENLFRDLASAFLFSFESTLQVLKRERRSCDTRWLESQSPYDVVCKGLRGLRNTGAHVRQVPVAANNRRAIASRFAHSTTGGTTAWAWPEITPSDLVAVDTPHLTVSDLPAWNAESDELLALGVMRHGVIALRDILSAAEPAPVA